MYWGYWKSTSRRRVGGGSSDEAEEVSGTPVFSLFLVTTGVPFYMYATVLLSPNNLIQPQAKLALETQKTIIGSSAELSIICFWRKGIAAICTSVAFNTLSRVLWTHLEGESGLLMCRMLSQVWSKPVTHVARVC